MKVISVTGSWVGIPHIPAHQISERRQILAQVKSFALSKYYLLSRSILYSFKLEYAFKGSSPITHAIATRHIYFGYHLHD